MSIQTCFNVAANRRFNTDCEQHIYNFGQSSHVGKGVCRHHGWLPWLQQLGTLKKNNLSGSLRLGMETGKYNICPFRTVSHNLKQLCALRPVLAAVRAAPPRTCLERSLCHASLLHAMQSCPYSSRKPPLVTKRILKPDSTCATYNVQWSIRSFFLTGA